MEGRSTKKETSGLFQKKYIKMCLKMVPLLFVCIMAGIAVFYLVSITDEFTDKRTDYEDTKNLSISVPGVNETKYNNTIGEQLLPISEATKSLSTPVPTNDENIKNDASTVHKTEPQTRHLLPHRVIRSIIIGRNCPYGEIWFRVACIECAEYEMYTGWSCPPANRR